MRNRFSLVLIAALLAATVAAQVTVRLEFPNAGARAVWVGPGLPEGPPLSPTKLDGQSFDFPLPGFGPTDRLFVLDEATGNLAAKPIGEIDKVWKVAPAEFKWVGAVQVRVEHEGKPVAAANVKVSDGKRSIERLLDPSAEGALSFAALLPGQLTITVGYTSEGKPAEPLKQIVELKLARDKPVPTFVVSIADAVETVGAGVTATPASGADPAPAEKPAPSSNPFGSALVYLVILAAILAGGYYGLQAMRKNPDVVTERLKKMGVQVPEPPDPADAGDATTPPIRAPGPPSQILLGGDAEPSAAAPVVPLAVGGVPTLVGATSTFEIAEGLSVVGREEGVPIYLEGESTISRRHAELVRLGNDVTVNDLGSTNGTFVNGTKIGAETTLKPGDEVQFGAVRFRYQG